MSITLLPEQYLRMPANNYLVTIWEAGEHSRLEEAVYNPILTKKPDLKPIFDDWKRCIDPIMRLDNAKEMETRYNQFRRQNIDHPFTQDLSLDAAYELFDALDELHDKNAARIIHAELHLSKIARAMREVIELHGRTIHNVCYLMPLPQIVLRTAYPNIQSCKAAIQDELSMLPHAASTQRKLQAIYDQEKPDNNTLRDYLERMPSADSMELLHKKTTQYYSKWLSATYSQNQ